VQSAQPDSAPWPVPRYRWRGPIAERTAWACGVVCLVLWGALQLENGAAARRDVERFARVRAAALQDTGATGATDVTLWDVERISAWQLSLHAPAPQVLAVLRIPKIRLEVPVLAGTSDVALDRGVGHIEETALPGADGNSGIAGHRDGFFRGLKDIGPDDTVELDTLRGKEVYRVERTWVVDPEDVSVLAPTLTRSLTLVTCYPFYHVGPAPQRYIVRAVRTHTALAIRRGS
jgi:sortase A